jgi:predicted histidine transporter YuiF (NhaC family)
VSWLVHGVRFACEIAAVVAVVWWGWPVLGLLLGIAVVVVWGAWVAPKARRRLPDPMRLLVELGIFALAAVAFAEVGQTAVAIVFAAASVLTAGLSRRIPAP